MTDAAAPDEPSLEEQVEKLVVEVARLTEENRTLEAVRDDLAETVEAVQFLNKDLNSGWVDKSASYIKGQLRAQKSSELLTKMLKARDDEVAKLNAQLALPRGDLKNSASATALTKGAQLPAPPADLPEKEPTRRRAAA